MKTLPYQDLLDKGWLIVGMNHYTVNGQRFLYCAMVKEYRCIKAYGESDLTVFRALERQAKEIE